MSARDGWFQVQAHHLETMVLVKALPQVNELFWINCPTSLRPWHDRTFRNKPRVFCRFSCEALCSEEKFWILERISNSKQVLKLICIRSSKKPSSNGLSLLSVAFLLWCKSESRLHRRGLPPRQEPCALPDLDWFSRPSAAAAEAAALRARVLALVRFQLYQGARACPVLLSSLYRR